MVDDLKAANLPDARSVIGDAVGDLFSRKSILQELLPGIDTPLRELLSRVIGGNSTSPPQSAAA